MNFCIPGTKGQDLPVIFCNLCSDEIDTLLGFYRCKECKEDYCKDCAVDRDKMETEMAENPFLVPTPFQDVRRESLTHKQLMMTKTDQGDIEASSTNLANLSQHFMLS